jgi:hypothetical protein
MLAKVPPRSTSRILDGAVRDLLVSHGGVCLEDVGRTAGDPDRPRHRAGKTGTSWSAEADHQYALRHSGSRTPIVQEIIAISRICLSPNGLFIAESSGAALIALVEGGD